MKKRHEQILEFIKGFCLEKGYSPTIREIGEGVGLKSTSSTLEHLKGMERAGLIIRDEYSPRSIRIPGICTETEKFDNKKQPFDTLSGGNNTLFVLHGHWSMPGDDGVNVWGVSPDLKMLQKRMQEVGKQMLKDAELSEYEIIFDRMEETDTRFEAESDDGGYYIRLYITEHRVEEGAGNDL